MRHADGYGEAETITKFLRRWDPHLAMWVYCAVYEGGRVWNPAKRQYENYEEGT